jgi:hypothetical protein
MKIVSGRPYRASDLGLDDPDGVLWGVYVGGCVHERDAWSIWTDTRSHAHHHRTNEWHGWVCIKEPKDVLTPKGRITATLAHEIAHLISGDARHSRKWKRTLMEMGFAGEILACGLKPL